MKKFIVAIDGLNYHSAAIEYAVEMSKLHDAHLTGILLDDRTYTSYKIYELIIEEGVSEKKLNLYNIRDQEARKISAEKFETACSHAGIHFNVHHDHDIASEELVRETIFADLLFIAASEKFSHHEQEIPSPFLRQLLNKTYCPVMVCPENHVDIQRYLFLYDGKPESVFAMKQFSLLFSGQTDMELEILSVRSVEGNLHLPQHHLVKEWLSRHYKHIHIQVFKGIPEIELMKYLTTKGTASLLVMGSYGRPAISRWLRPSLADSVLDRLPIPVFIAHNR